VGRQEDGRRVTRSVAYELALPTGPGGHTWQLRRLARGSGLALLLLLVAFLFVAPIAMLIIAMLHNGPPGSDGTWSVEGLRRTFTDPRTYLALQNSVAYAASTTIIGTALGAVFAFLAARTNVPLRSWLNPVMLLVFAAPNVLYAVSWSLLADPASGLLNQAVSAVAGYSLNPFNAYSWPGLVFVQGLKLTAFAYLLLIGPFQSMNRSFEEASLISGASRLGTLVRIDIPLMAPAIFGVVVISVVFGLSAFDIPQILGALADIPVLSTEIFRAVNFAIPPDYARAASLGLFMMAALAALLALQWRVLKSGRFVTVTGKSARQQRWDLGGWNVVAGGAILAYTMVTLVLPGVQLVLTSFEPAIGVFNLTLGNYRSILSDPQTAGAFRTTALLAIGAGAIAMLLATLLGHVGRNASGVIDKVLDSATLIPMVMPGVVLAIGMLWLYISVPGLQLLYATVWLALIGLVVIVMPVTSRAARAALAQIARELEEAASVCGASDLRVLVDIVLRLMACSFLSGWLLAGVIAAGTLDVPLMLLPPTSPNVAVLAYTSVSAAMPNQASALLVLLLLAILGVALAYAAGSAALSFARVGRARRQS
jgi:iron(III) transport system permease protein